MISERQKNQAFGDRIVCVRCGIPRKPDFFRDGETTCVDCEVSAVSDSNGKQMVPEKILRTGIREKLEIARKSSDPSVISGYEKAEEILGKSPQEIAAQILKEMNDPCQGMEGLTPEQIAAIPKDYKTMRGFLELLQQAQFRRDEQLLGSDPISDASPEELRATILKGVLDSIDSDTDLRLQLIRGFASRCPSFFDEVFQIAQEMGHQFPFVVERSDSEGAE